MGKRKMLQYMSDVPWLLETLPPGGVTRGIGSSMMLTYKTRELGQQQSCYLCLLHLFIYFYL